VAARLQWGLVPAVPVPFRGNELAGDAQTAYALWLARQPVAGVAVWAHTGRGRHLSATARARVLEIWRGALPGRLIVAGAGSVEMAREARRGGADALLAFPVRDDPIGYHRALGAELPVILFDLYEAAGGVAYDDATLIALLALPDVIGIKIATLDSVMRFQHLAALVAAFPEKVLITGEDRFLGYSLMLGARAALIGLGAALTDLSAQLLDAFAAGDHTRFIALSVRVDRFGAATFVPPMEGYVRRLLWALAADGVIAPDACDDPWGPALPSAGRDLVTRTVRALRGM
jgi:4-hydroxy-tetrahydrodipicolinate synthase